MKLLLDEMYPPALAKACLAGGIEASTVVERGLAGRSDPDVFAAAGADGCALLTENVSDFARISVDLIVAGGHHPGLVIALSSRFSRRPAGIADIVAALHTVADQDLRDRLVYLERPGPTER